MKTTVIFFLTVLCSILLIGCDNNVSDRVFSNYERIEGSWKLVSMEFIEDGHKKTIDTSRTTLSFLGNRNRNTIGKIKTTDGDFDFSYNLALENCSIDVSNANDILPLDAPGRQNLFSIKFNGKNEFIITTPLEHFKPKDILLRNVTYRFIRN